jgi:hypothetical protein
VSEGNLEAVQLPVRWVGIEDYPLVVANQLLGQIGPGEVILNFGQVTPPAIMPGTPEQQAEQLAQYTYVPVRTVARLGLNRAKLEEFIGVLQQTLANYDQAHQQLEEGKDG